MNKLKIIVNSMIKENPTFVLFLGMCPVLITSSSIFSAFAMSLCILLVLFLSNTAISLVKYIVPEEIHIPIYILIIATIVTLVQMLVKAYLPSVFDSIGDYIAMIVVNCIILGRAESYASKHSVVDSMMDAIGIACGFFCAVMSVAIVRELLGTGGLTFINPFDNTAKWTLKIIPSKYAIEFFTQEPGAFFTLGVAVAVINAIKNSREAKAKEKAKAAKAAATTPSK